MKFSSLLIDTFINFFKKILAKKTEVKEQTQQHPKPTKADCKTANNNKHIVETKHQSVNVAVNTATQIKVTSAQLDKVKRQDAQNR